MKRIILIIYAVVISATMICASIFTEYIVIGIESCIPIICMASMLLDGVVEYNRKKGRYYYRNGRLYHYQPSFDFKYTKDSTGDGKLQMTNEDMKPDPSSRIFAYCLFIGAALNIPFVIFFPLQIKLYGWAAFLLSPIVSLAISLPRGNKEAKKAIEEEKARQEQWKKELEEQKKREELGRWK